MPSVKYKSCTFEGSRASAVLAFREAVSAAANLVQDELSKLDHLTSHRKDEDVVLTGQTPVTLLKLPIRTPTDSLVVRSKTEAQGYVYRAAPKLDLQKVSTLQDGSTSTNGRGGLVDTTESALAQWMFQKSDASAYSASDDLNDCSFFGKTALISGTAPSVDDGGPLGRSRSFSNSTYFTIPTRKALLEISASQLMIRGDVSAWGWVKPSDDGTEHVLCSFSSPPTNPAAHLIGTANLTNGSAVFTVTSAVGLNVLNRVIFSSQTDRMYEIQSIVGTTVTLTEPYVGTSDAAASMTLTFSVNTIPPIMFGPEQRNTLYGLSVQKTGSNVQARAYWQHRNRQTVEATNSVVTWPTDEYFFVGFQRRTRKLAGTISTNSQGPNTMQVIGIGTSFMDEFTNGAPGSPTNTYIQLAGNARNFRVMSVASQTLMTIEAPTSFVAFSGVAFTSVRTMVHVGKLDGSFNTQTTDHLPNPTGGLESKPVDPSTRTLTGEALADFHIGRDFEDPSTNFVGSMNCLSIYMQALDSTEAPAALDTNVRRMFSRAFPDYVAVDQTIKRSVLSDITDGQTVFCSYDYASSLTTALATTDGITTNVDSMIVGLDNPKVKTTSQLAQTIGAPDPAQQSDQTHLDQQMNQFGMMVVNGQPFIRGATDPASYMSLVQTVGSVNAADALLAGKPNRSFVLVAITEDISELQVVDSCGRPSTQVLITERIVGINTPLQQAAFVAGNADTSLLKLKFWWIGSVGNDDGTVQKLRQIGMTGADIADAMALQSSDHLKVQVIEVPDLSKRLTDNGISSNDVNAIAVRPTATISINTSPTPQNVAKVVQNAMAAPSGNTIDGDSNPQNPALLVAATVDLGKALKSRTDDLFPAQVLNDMDQDCQALVAVIDDQMVNLTKMLKRLADKVVPFSLKTNASIGTHKLAFSTYIPCVANVSASFGLPPFHLKINRTIKALKHLQEQLSSVTTQAETVADRFNRLLCIPRTFIGALRGGVCGIEQPQAIANRLCPSQLDVALDRLKALVDTAELLIRKILEAITNFPVDVDVTIGAASSLAIDATLPCIGPVATLLQSFHQPLGAVAPPTSLGPSS